MFSLVIPVFNEEDVIEDTVRTMHDILDAIDQEYEIVVVDDGSTDRTASILDSIDLPTLRVVKHEGNRGNGAAIKTGVRYAKGDRLGLIDADGTYPMQDYPKLIRLLYEKNADMVVGARTKKGVQIPWNRKHAKMFVTWLASSLIGQRIPDINSGMRLFTRELFERYEHLYPQGFSLHITITLAALTNNYNVVFEPIDYYKRVGASTMSLGFNGIKHFLNFLSLIIRIVTYFRPFKFFIWPSLILMISGLLYIGYTLKTDANISDAGMLLLLTGIQIGLFGLLAEVVVRQGRAKK